MIQWDPGWQKPGEVTPSGGQFNVWVVRNPGNAANDLSVYVVGGVGNGHFTPGPGDYVCLSVTYDPLRNAVIAYVVDLSTGAAALLIYDLGSVFMPPMPARTYSRSQIAPGLSMLIGASSTLITRASQSRLNVLAPNTQWAAVEPPSMLSSNLSCASSSFIIPLTSSTSSPNLLQVSITSSA